MKIFRDAQKIGAYYPIGSEILTQDIIQELLSNGKEVFLPRVSGENMEFKKIMDFSSLENGSFEIMEPKIECTTENNLGCNSSSNSRHYSKRSQIRIWSGIL